MKKKMILSAVLIVGLISSTFLYASKSGSFITGKEQLPKKELLQDAKQVELFRSLYFF